MNGAKCTIRVKNCIICCKNAILNSHNVNLTELLQFYLQMFIFTIVYLKLVKIKIFSIVILIRFLFKTRTCIQKLIREEDQ